MNKNVTYLTFSVKVCLKITHNVSILSSGLISSDAKPNFSKTFFTIWAWDSSSTFSFASSCWTDFSISSASSLNSTTSFFSSCWVDSISTVAWKKNKEE